MARLVARLRLLLTIVACVQATENGTDDSMVLLQVRAGYSESSIARLESTDGKLNVAFAVFITDVADPGFKDAVTVMAYGMQKAVKKSQHNIDLVALTPERLDADGEKFLLSVGFKEVMKKPIPVMPSDIQGVIARAEMTKTNGQGVGLSFAQSEETIKYWGLADTRYDRVLVLDADILVLDPMDDLLARPEDFIGVYDHGLDGNLPSTLPPTQGGFLLFRPNETDFEGVKALTREGDWGGNGWKGSGVGYCYGGVGPDGLLAYYFNQQALPLVKALGKSALPEGTHAVEGSRMLAAERAVYDVVLNDRLKAELASSADRDATVAAVKSVHFTGDCIKPWTCFHTEDWFCNGLLDKWWELRGELATQRGVAAETVALGFDGACKAGVYSALPSA